MKKYFHNVVNYYLKNGIAIVEMIDKEARNTFSLDLINGLIDIFSELSQEPTLKCVVIHGFDNYFCCGGTKEELLEIYSGNKTFADFAFYRLLLDCEVPTIAAMQGHAIGGGLAFACYADLMILSEESIYSANFMKYGFTPGMGATYIIPKKFGEMISNELLYTAGTYHGGTLKQKGLSIPVIKKTEVITTAIKLAEQLIDKSTNSLKILKSHLTQPIKDNLPKIISQELLMHQNTFNQPEVKVLIDSLFNQ